MKLFDYIFMFLALSGIIFWMNIILQISFYYVDKIFDKIEKERK